MIVENIAAIRAMVKESILRRDSEFENHISNPSQIWKRWLGMLGFVFDFSDENLERIRLHTGFGFFLGSNWSKVYFEKNEIELGLKPIGKSKTINDYNQLTHNVSEEYHCSEIDNNREIISIAYKGKYINEDVLRVQSTISNLAILGKGNIESYLEIGAGYGLLSNQFKRVFKCKNTVVVDHPEVIFWSAVYTLINNREAKIRIVNSVDEEWEEEEFVFIPCFLVDVLKGKHFDLTVNENSFCEMTAEQVAYYLALVNTDLLYTNNRDRQFMNHEGVNLNEMLNQHYHLLPDLDYYEKRYSDEEDRHNLKYIYYAAKNCNALPEFDPSDLCGCTIRREF